LNVEDSSKKIQRLAEPFALVAVVVLLVLSGFITFENTRRLRSHTDLVERSHQFIRTLERIESTVKSAEVGQRGFVITGQEAHLERYYAALEELEALPRELDRLTGGDALKQTHIVDLQELIARKMEELAAGIELRRSDGFELVQTVVETNISKRTLDGIHAIIEEMRRLESQVMRERSETAAATYWTALATGLLSTIAGIVLVLSVLYLVQSNRRRAEGLARIIQDERDQLQESLDRTQRLERENERMDLAMRNFLEQIEDYAIFAMDADYRATTWNRGVLKVLGFEEWEFVGQDIRELIFTPEAVAMGIPDAEFALAAVAGSASDDRWMMRKGSERFWASGISSAIKDGNSVVVGYSKVMRDLTQRKRDQDELAELAARLSESDRRKNEFLATLAHELRNPLAPIKNAIQLLEMSELNPEVEELRGTMARQVEQLIRLVDDLLDVSRIGRGKIALRKEAVDLRRAIESAAEVSGGFIREKQQHLHLQLGDEAIVAKVDPARITQVVSNLLNNASRYSDCESHIDLRLTLEVEDAQQEWAIIKVSDNGIGIAADRMDEIFRMFSQVHDSLERGSAGLGIGLTLVKTLVEVHGGIIAVHSDGIGLGSTFTVKLPTTREDDLPEAKTMIPSAEFRSRTFRVLVVEDMHALRVIMSRLLRKLGHHVEVAEDALCALEKLNEFMPEIIFSDISMPGMTGYDLARKLREHTATSKIYLVAMTGYGQSADRMEARHSGFDEHMVKPVDIAKLRALFDRLSQS
jgi:two-component system CheB/CheR fusion protein